jgi:hypothetical protein
MDLASIGRKETQVDSTRTITLAICFLVGVCLGACSDPSDNNDNNGDGDDAGDTMMSDAEDGGEDVVDTGGDTEGDAEDVETDVSACAEACTGETPYCDEASGECVACLGDDDCSAGVCTESGACVACEENGDCASGEVCYLDADDAGNNACVTCVEGEGCAPDTVCVVDEGDPSANVCAECGGDGDCDGVCDEGGDSDPSNNVCVGCLEDADCTDATASTCNTSTNTCEACATNDDCTGIADGEVCDTSGASGVCVECLVGEEGACSSGECDPDTNECVSRTTGTKMACEQCSADDECAPYHHCVPMDFAGSAHGNYCLKVESAGCTQPFLIGETKTSLGGVDALFCTLNENLTTCEALADLEAGATDQCDPSATDLDAECGDPSLADGLCRKVGVIDNKCTYECELGRDCPPNAGIETCIEVDGGPDYCGG